MVTKAVGDTNNLVAIPFRNEKGEMKAKCGDYTVKLLPTNPEERKEEMDKKEVSTVKDYYLSCLPAQVQLAERMRRRGQRVDPGTRLEYVITDEGGHLAKQCEKVESMDYFAAHSDILKIDYMYYLKQLTNPVDQVLDAAYGGEVKDFVLKQYNYRLKIRTKMINELKTMFNPKITLIEK